MSARSSSGESEYEKEIGGGDAEKENVIKVFKDNGLENCLGGDASDTEEVFKICRVFGVDQIVSAMKAFVPPGRVDLLKAFLKIFLKNTKRIADVYVAGGPNARLNFLKLQKNLLLSSIQAFEQKTQAVFQTLEEQHQQEWIQYLQRGPLFSSATAYRDEVPAAATSAAKPGPAAAAAASDGIFRTASPTTAASRDWVITTATEAGTTAAVGGDGIFTTATTAYSATAAGSVEIFTTATAGRDWDSTTVTTTSWDWISTTATATAGHHWGFAAAGGFHWVLATAAAAAGPTTTAAS
ncbi:hypothetical protein AB3S75_015205 [Citrus x aurantiifolia]